MLLYNPVPLRSFVTPFLYLSHPTTSRRHILRRCRPTAAALHTSHQFYSCFLENIVRPQMDSESFTFGPYKIDPKEVFYATQLSYALVNLRPVVPDVLVCPRREVKRFVDLTADEVSDLWLSAQNIGCRLESYHKASSLTYAIQDGPEAGQTVPHVHIHILPRKSSDFEKNDQIYDAIDLKEKELKQKLDLDQERKDRSMEEMAEEADSYRKLLL